MKALIRIVFPVLLVSAIAFAQNTPTAERELSGSPLVPNPSFDKIKALAGHWEGTALGHKTIADYQVMSAGSIVILNMPGDKPGNEMITVFHTDNEKLMVTHYCSAKNQPRMRMVPGSDPNVIKFEFFDATNLPSAKTPHMVGLTIKILDKDHHIQTWKFDDGGKTLSEDFDYHRKT